MLTLHVPGPQLTDHGLQVWPVLEHRELRLRYVEGPVHIPVPLAQRIQCRDSQFSVFCYCFNQELEVMGC